MTVRKRIREVAELLRERNQLDARIAGIIGRPPHAGHLAEFVAQEVFDIRLEASASAKGIDGRFTRGPLGGKTVNVKWKGKHEGLLNLPAQGQGADYYLVFTGRPAPPRSSRGTQAPWAMSHVFLFDGRDLLKALRGRKIGIATSVARHLWDKAEIYPKPTNPLWQLSEAERELLGLFSDG